MWNLGDGTADEHENKECGGLLDQGINHEWKTNMTRITDATGEANFRGFHGKQVICLTVGTEKREFPFELKSNRPAAGARHGPE